MVKNDRAWRKSSFSGPDGGDCVEVMWRKSSFSDANNGDCVEVAWQKSSFSAEDGGDCVEVAFGPETVGVRDSKNSDGGVLRFTAAQWQRFVESQ